MTSRDKRHSNIDGLYVVCHHDRFGRAGRVSELRFEKAATLIVAERRSVRAAIAGDDRLRSGRAPLASPHGLPEDTLAASRRSVRRSIKLALALCRVSLREAVAPCSRRRFSARHFLVHDDGRSLVGDSRHSPLRSSLVIVGMALAKSHNGIGPHGKPLACEV